MQSCLPWDTGKDRGLKNIKLYALYKSPLLLYCRIWVIRETTPSVVTGPSQNKLQTVNYLTLRSSADTWILCIPNVRTKTFSQQSKQRNSLPSDIHHIKILSHLQNCFKNSLRTTNKWFQTRSSYLPPLFTLTTPHYTPLHPCQRLCMRAYVCVHACIRVLGDGNYM